MLQRFASRASDAPLTDGRVVYAVGDIHGRIDLLESLLRAVMDDIAATRAPGTQRAAIVFLGDYVDRGLHSREVLDRVVALQAQAGASDAAYDVRFLKGNHEAAMLAFMDAPHAGRAWLAHGGAETLFSYGVPAPPPKADPETYAAAARALRAAMAPAHHKFLRSLELMARYGACVFVHAGVRPDRDLDAQSEADLLTIRDPFIRDRGRWPYYVVHGHTPVEAAEVRGKRISVDTGAYVTGRLTAARLEDGDVSFLST